jgi:ArsR family transcriptional regulator, arsenate/arsenite/antimonite-responsive transcriptional repressor
MALSSRRAENMSDEAHDHGAIVSVRDDSQSKRQSKRRSKSRSKSPSKSRSKSPSMSRRARRDAHPERSEQDQRTDACDCVPGKPTDKRRDVGAKVVGAAILFKALSDETRLRILELLAKSSASLCACDIEDCFSLTQPTISHHMKALREAGLVDAEKRGAWVYYTLLPRGARALEAAARLSGAGSDIEPAATVGLIAKGDPRRVENLSPGPSPRRQRRTPAPS